MGRHSHRPYEVPWNSDFTPPADVFETDDSIVAVLELPGISHESLRVVLDGDALIVAGHRAETGGAKLRLHQIEILYGGFERRIPLPPGVTSDGIRAHYRHGLLRVEIPKGRGPRRSGRIAVS